MPVLIYFVESYTAGGSDKVANILLRNLNAEKIVLMVNRTVNKRILLTELPSSVSIQEYGLITPMDIGLFANTYKKYFLLYRLIKVVDYLLRYPLILFSIFYFYAKFKKLNATHFIAHNGGYPGGFYCGTAAVAASKIKGVKLFYAYHSVPMKYLFPQSLLEKCWDKYIDRHCTMISVSNFSCTKLNERRKFINTPICIYNGLKKVAQKEYGTHTELRLLHIGYFDSNKNQKMILESISKLIDRGIDKIKVTFVGEISQKEVYDEFIGMMNQLELKEFVNLEGFKNRVDDYYKNNDVLLLTSKIEGFPMVVLEAMRVGMPIIATNVGGVSEQVLDAKNGFLIDKDDCEALSRKIEYFYHNRNKVKIYGTNSFRIFNENFSVERMVDDYNKVLQLQ